MLNEVKRLQELAGIDKAAVQQPSDVKRVSTVQGQSTSLKSANKNINQTNEFEGAFETWFNTLGYKPGKLSTMIAKNAVGKVLTKLGYK